MSRKVLSMPKQHDHEASQTSADFQLNRLLASFDFVLGGKITRQPTCAVQRGYRRGGAIKTKGHNGGFRSLECRGDM